MVDTLVTVLTVCAPLFAMILFGVLLKRSGALTDDAHRFISGLVYRFSLPVLVFTGICKADFLSLLNPAARAAVGTAVLLMVCPVSVALYVMSKQFEAEPEFVASALATTTAVSCITIPLWVAIVL